MIGLIAFDPFEFGGLHRFGVGDALWETAGTSVLHHKEAHPEEDGTLEVPRAKHGAA